MVYLYIVTVSRKGYKVNNNKFKIGEFSKLNRISVKTLRHYDEIGLLKPHEVDDWTGYRYYDASQFQKVSAILYLKKLRFSLEEIREMFERNAAMPSSEKILEKIQECEREKALLDWQLRELLELEKRLRKGISMKKISTKTLPAMIVASFRKVLKNYDELSDLCCNVIGPEMVRCGCTCNNYPHCYTVEHDPEHRETDIDVEYCEAVDAPFADSPILKCKRVAEVKTAVCIEHIGSYHLFQQSMGALVKYIEKNGYRIVDLPRFCYLDGPWNKEDESAYRTEIQVPVEKA